MKSLFPFLAAAITSGAVACQDGAAAPAASAPVPVTVAAAEARDVAVELRSVGTVESPRAIAIRPQVSGPIQSAHFHEGDEVKQGDLLFTIDPRPFEAALAQAEATLARDRAQAKGSAADLKRAEDLFAQGIMANDARDRATAAGDAAAASVMADEANVRNAKLQLDYCSIRSPIDGRTGSILIKAGNMVRAIDGGPLVMVNQMSPITVVFSVPESRFPQFRASARGRALEVLAFPKDSLREPAKGSLSFLDNEIDRATGTAKLKATFANTDRRLWPGQFVDARVTLEVNRGAIVVPAQAVQDGQGGRYVLVVTKAETAEVRKVQAGATRDDVTVIEKGLAVGEIVVVDGHVRVIPGGKVEARPVKSTAP